MVPKATANQRGSLWQALSQGFRLERGW